MLGLEDGHLLTDLEELGADSVHVADDGAGEGLGGGRQTDDLGGMGGGWVMRLLLLLLVTALLMPCHACCCWMALVSNLLSFELLFLLSCFCGIHVNEFVCISSTY